MTKSFTLVFAFLPVIAGAQGSSVRTDTTVSSTLNPVIISASRISEKQLAAPVSISVLSSRGIVASPSGNFYDAAGQLKGVHMIAPSLGFKVLNTRGFSNTTNVRFVQLVDGVDNQSPHIGAPIADALVPGELDIERVEVVQGVASALYGMNATNGLVNILTKDPFTSAGISFRQQTGVNHISDPGGTGAKLYTNSSIRWASVLSKRWAFKVNLGYVRGYDWVANNTEDLNPKGNASTNLTGADNPGYDGVNIYGNESSDRKTITLGGKSYVVARTGYAERDVTDYTLENLKGNAAVYYKVKDNAVLSYTYTGALLNSVYQRANRFRLQDYSLQQHALQYHSPVLQLRAYLTHENTGNSYNLRSMAENLDIASKSNNQWYADYTTAFNSAVSAGNNVAAALHSARDAADAGRLQPGTDAFNNRRSELQQINNWDIGAALKVKANLIQTEGAVDLSKWLGMDYLQLTAGADFRDYVIVPDGNYFINPTDSGKNLNYTSFGAFVRASKGFLNERLQISAALRATKYEYFDVTLNPRITAVYELSKDQYVRASFQNGYRYPSIFEGFSNINSGGVKRVGGLPVMSNGVFENIWLKTSIDAFQAAVNKDVNTNGMSQTAALDKNKGLLKRSTYTYVKPEEMTSYEIGYRRVFLNRRLFIDADAYYNNYKNFIAQFEGSVPNTTDDGQIPASLYDKAKQARYRMYTNSNAVVHNYGAELDARYVIDRHFTASANASYQTLKKNSQDDGLEDGYNTPEWMLNAGIAGSNIYKGLGFGITAKYQSDFYYQSFLINGTVPSIFNADAAVSYTFTKPALNVKVGASNVFNHYYYSILGGPQIGGLYYTTLTLNLN